MVHRTWSAVFGLLSLAILMSHTACAADPALPPPEVRDAFRRPADIPYPVQNPYTAAKTELGKLLFFDPIISGSGTRSCGSCHNPGLSWGDGLPRAIGEARTPLAYRSPTTLNLAWSALLGWDGKFPDLERVTFTPIVGNANMNRDESGLLHDLTAIPEYRRKFAAAFTDGKVTRRNIELAIATYERTIVSGPAPFDRWIGGDAAAIGDQAKQGFALFLGKGDCVACHSGWNFTDSGFHDVGVAGDADLGRGRLFPNSVALQHAFKTPTLRDVAHRAPYMHDGSVPNLAAVVDLYNRGGVERPSRDAHVHPLDLSDGEKADLVAFLETLTGDDPPTVMPGLPR